MRMSDYSRIGIRSCRMMMFSEAHSFRVVTKPRLFGDSNEPKRGQVRLDFKRRCGGFCGSLEFHRSRIIGNARAEVARLLHGRLVKDAADR